MAISPFQTEPNPAALALAGVGRRYVQGAGTIEVLRGADLVVERGQSVALVAPSGSGKSTLLHMAGLLEHPDEGEVFIDGQPTVKLPDRERTRMRRVHVGFVYQSHNLLAEFSALENVMMPQMIRGLSKKDAAARAKDLLSYLGLGHRLVHRPSELSGGEQQRVAIARALANAPRLLLADEPTGNLDPKTSDHVFSALAELVHATGVAAIIATHNLQLAARMHRRVTVIDGRIVELD
ncbi:MAG: ABC transporter [Rhizobiales bacterium 32-66-11]|jgi:lipoprotein-releasing system ATP-binding protein|nr:MAG: ABC transporter [Rhizobiales bacterium 32-66-11]